MTAERGMRQEDTLVYVKAADRAHAQKFIFLEISNLSIIYDPQSVPGRYMGRYDPLMTHKYRRSLRMLRSTPSRVVGVCAAHQRIIYP